MQTKVRLGDAFTLIGGGTPSTNRVEYWGEGTPWFSSADIDAKGKISYRRCVTQIGIKNSTTNIVPANTVIVVTRVGLGKIAILPENMCFSQDMQALLAKDDSFVYSRKYLYYQLVHIMETVKYQGQGTTISGITKKRLADVMLYMPGIEEQQRIVARIEELFSQLDDAEATLQKTKAQLVLYRQAVLKKAFEGRLTHADSHVEVRLGDYIEMPRYGTSKKCSYESAGDRIPVYRIPNIDHETGRISHDDMKYALFTENEVEGIRLREGDILIIRSNGSVSLVGRAAMVYEADTSGSFAGYLMRLRIKNKEALLPKYLLQYLNSYQARVYIENKAKSTSGVHNINSTEIADLRIQLYDRTEQLSIIEAIEARLSVCDNIEQTLGIALQQTTSIRRNILKKAFEGRL